MIDWLVAAVACRLASRHTADEITNSISETMQSYLLSRYYLQAAEVQPTEVQQQLQSPPPPPLLTPLSQRADRAQKITKDVAVAAGAQPHLLAGAPATPPVKPDRAAVLDKGGHTPVERQRQLHVLRADMEEGAISRATYDELVREVYRGELTF